MATQPPVDQEETGEFSTDAPDAEPTSDVPSRIGRFRVERILGQGGFGSVYLAHDDDLRRCVTIKVPHRRHVSTPTDIESFLAEARTLANLEHPSVVPVHEVGRTDNGLC